MYVRLDPHRGAAACRTRPAGAASAIAATIGKAALDDPRPACAGATLVRRAGRCPAGPARSAQRHGRRSALSAPARCGRPACRAAPGRLSAMAYCQAVGLTASTSSASCERCSARDLSGRRASRARRDAQRVAEPSMSPAAGAPAIASSMACMAASKVAALLAGLRLALKKVGAFALVSHVPR